MNISKLIAKFILASFVFSSMQGPVLAIGGLSKNDEERIRITNEKRQQNAARNAARKDSVSGSKTQGQPTQEQPTQEQQDKAPESKTPEQPILKSSAAIAQTKELLTKLLATVKTDISSLKGQAVNLYNGSLGSVQFTKEGALNMLAKVTPESTLGKAGVVAVIVTGGIVFYYIRKNGMPGAEIVKVVAGKVGNYVTLPSAATVVKGAAVLGAVSLAAAGLYAYKTGNVRPLANVAYPVVGVPALYAASKLAGYAKNLATSGVSNITSGAKTVASKAVKTAGSYTPDFVKSAASTVGSTVKSTSSTVVSGVKKVGSSVTSAASYLKFWGKKPAEQPVKNTVVQSIINAVNNYSKASNWSLQRSGRKRGVLNYQQWQQDTLKLVDKLEATFDKNTITNLVNVFFASKDGEDRLAKAKAVVDFFTSNK